MKKVCIYLTRLLFITGLFYGCQKKLEEEPHSVLTPDFFTTAQGFDAGLNAAYSGTRWIWGPQDYYSLTVCGTDEFKRGVDGSSDLNTYSSNYTASNGNVTNVWKYCYTYINTCNGLVDNAPKIPGMDSTLKKRMVGEARFLRANYYFILVQQWGDVTLNRHFQSTPTTSAVRDPLADVYDFIIEDLNAAIASLPPGPLSAGVQPGRATAAAATHLLAKVYLTRAGSRAKKADDYKNAYATATALINNSGASGVGLLPDFAKVFQEGNEANMEVLWTVQHTSNLAYNGSPKQDNRDADNLLCHLWVPQYENQPGMQRDVFYGRPYIRVIPTRWLTDTVFADKVNDTRYSKSFQIAWICNARKLIPDWPDPLPPGAPASARPGQPRFGIGDTAIFMPGYEMPDAQIKATPYQVITPGKYAPTLAPALTKYFDTKRTDMNAPSIRPIIVYRLADTYLVAAEAAFMDGRPADALPFINAIRRRAAYPTGNPQEMEVQVADLSLDFILDERARELCGELTRWQDLVRTGQLVKRVRLHNTDGQKNIQEKHMLRPVPQTQIDATTTGAKYPQNPQW
ncbi:RagB/SusD family nutrient uptake outer membrane protein [Chitinophaga filiformis]|uniref:RagB/SusD family nutrient uptake outer membrane protein n=1 Tax=Chitinophaga filiformis TaxID=104663 RepID=A0ABY4HXJ0_CHIFI|nr:RagB/SusD family nutrient uptake outer membrane protein [Chitinophaga filiformis]UPK68526.1 RagB/SusD family nutrient uptake outer membrane protein [Chitinophaga filiformis]